MWPFRKKIAVGRIRMNYQPLPLDLPLSETFTIYSGEPVWFQEEGSSTLVMRIDRKDDLITITQLRPFTIANAEDYRKWAVAIEERVKDYGTKRTR